MSDIIELQGQYYIQANASIADLSTRTLKQADTFAIFDRHGNIRPLGFENHGVFHEGTRFVSRWKLLLNGTSPLLLSSNVKEDNDFLTADLTNPNLTLQNGKTISHGTIHFIRTIFLWNGNLFERTEISNFALEPVSLTLEFQFQSDFIDLFEIRGNKRKERGQTREPIIAKQEVTCGYEGLDSVLRQTRFHFSVAPDEIYDGRAVFKIELKPQEQKAIESCVHFSLSRNSSTAREDTKENFDGAFQKVHEAYEEYRKEITLVKTSNPQFNDWINQSRADLHLLLTKTPSGYFPYAGIPWFSCVFGRDSIITALETLWLYPEIARGVLGYLAARQATETNAERDSEPGKILHEERHGEMVALNEVPFGCYYGSIDSTPLWLVLAGNYFERTGDEKFIRQLWPNIERALEWIDRYGDRDGDGFVEYSRSATGGLSNQGWKDADDSVFHDNGEIARPPIALCEVQGYVYEAKLHAARLAETVGHSDKAKQLRQAAEDLKKKFHEKFWCNQIRTYAIALDNEKKPCCIRSSNAAQTLFTGIAQPEAARKICDDLLAREFFTGWGIRTISSSEPRYNPMSYHNGSIWPHDNALIALGLARYGFKDATLKILNALFDASQFMELNRLPELFCGFTRRRGEGPTLYPVACNPQAWSSAAVFCALQACLGLRVETAARKIYFNNPDLPENIHELEIKNLKVADANVDILLTRHEHDVGVNIRRRSGIVDVVVIH
ncbi:MAG TPA: amylo-alpha-1,6-glucosidase [Verrucomicrobiae bacterium]|nr:amylo-alpha-1,6-glucosidase [Verrucomicrobiae bacterium]